MRDAVRDLEVERIGHGVRAIEDLALVDELAEKGIVLEVCPGSNVTLGIYKTFRDHPIAELDRRGCKVTISTDDPRSSTPRWRGSMRRCTGPSIGTTGNSGGSRASRLTRPFVTRIPRRGSESCWRPEMLDHLTVVSHPLVQHKLTLMREKDTSTASFPQALARDQPALGL